MKPVPVNKITKALTDMLARDPRFEAVTIERSPMLNLDPSKCPWVGVYRTRSEFTARTLGYGAGARYQTTQLALIVQESAANEPSVAEDDHEKLIANLLDAIFADPTLAGTVRTTTLASVEYQMVATEDENLLLSAQLLVTFETVTQ